MIGAMQGLHLTADLHRCAAPAALLADRKQLRVLALGAVATAGLTPVGDLFHAFAPGGAASDVPAPRAPAAGGVTGVVLLAESHLALHTWPELAAVTLDVYVCNHAADNSERAEALLAALEAAFAPADCERRRVQRGNIGASACAPAA
jgi:S-adenosylmethionine/arginine decarboxylase-like enzyme